MEECAQCYRVTIRLKKEGTKIHCLLQTTLTSSQCSTEASVVGNFCWLNEQKCEALFLCASCTPTAMYVALGRDRERERERKKKERKKETGIIECQTSQDRFLQEYLLLFLSPHILSVYNFGHKCQDVCANIRTPHNI